MAGGGSTHDGEGEGGPRSLAKPHPEIEQRRHSKTIEQPAMSRFGRHVPGDTVIEGARIDGMHGAGGSTANIAVQDHGNT